MSTSDTPAQSAATPHEMAREPGWYHARLKNRCGEWWCVEWDGRWWDDNWSDEWVQDSWEIGPRIPSPASRAPADPALAQRLAALDAKATPGVLTIEYPLGEDVHSIVQADKEPYDWAFFASVSPDDDDDGSPGHVTRSVALANAQLIVALVNAYRDGTLRATPAAADGGWPISVTTAERLYEAIKHGDEQHRRWLHETLMALARPQQPPAAEGRST